MKIGNKVYYDLYYGALDLQIKEEKETSKIFKKGLDNIKSLMESYKPYIDSECSTPYTVMLGTPLSIINGRLKDRVVIKDKLYTKEAFNFYYKKYKDALVRYEKHQQIIKRLENQKVDYKTYQKIIRAFNLKISKEIVERRYVFDLGYGLGKLAAIRKYSNKPSVNWAESNKAKQRILDAGNIPYYKEEEEKAIAEGKEYNGVRWLVKHDNENVWIRFITKVKSYNFQLIKSNISSSLKYTLNEMKQSKKYNPKQYPLIEDIR